ncbi:AraC family transcriptional regulator [Bernardetia sp. Wsw4-3y2]|uniref:helix-turn-helix transcriptional regulator n=1 Tax=Bernardetia sp. Wsw4-3y2 TaxID=3127471 RepID=UPI0030D2D123
MLTDQKIYYQDSSIQIARNHYAKTKSDMPLHSHDFLTISLLLNGNIAEKTSQDQIHKAGAGHVSIKPPQVIHSDSFAENSSLLSLKIYDWEYYDLDFKEWSWIAEQTLIPYFLPLIQQKNKKEAIKQLKKTLAICLQQQSTHIPTWLSEIATYINNNHEKNIVITEIAQDINKHPFHVGHFFKKFYGMDIKTYQQNLRIRNSFAQVIEQNESLTEIAYKNGFSDQSHFCRTFKKITHFTPRKALNLIDV